jgi:hypothetical protein
MADWTLNGDYGHDPTPEPPEPGPHSEPAGSGE